MEKENKIFRPVIGDKVRNRNCGVHYYEKVLRVHTDHFILEKSGKWFGTAPGWETMGVKS